MADPWCCSQVNHLTLDQCCSVTAWMKRMGVISPATLPEDVPPTHNPPPPNNPKPISTYLKKSGVDASFEASIPELTCQSRPAPIFQSLAQMRSVSSQSRPNRPTRESVQPPSLRMHESEMKECRLIAAQPTTQRPRLALKRDLILKFVGFFCRCVHLFIFSYAIIYLSKLLCVCPQMAELFIYFFSLFFLF